MKNNLEPQDAAARREALTPGCSYIVQAPAGSGKTELLTQRFLTLLALVDRPEQILAITFTRKAAAEMRDRVLKAIESAQTAVAIDEPEHKRRTRELGRAVLEQSRAREWGLLTNPARLRIQTVDSFCASVVQQMPLQAGFGAASGIAEEDSRRAQLFEQAALNTIKALLGSGDEGAGAITRVLQHLDNNVGSAAGLIAQMLARRDQWERHVTGQDTAALRHEFEGVLRRVVEQALRRVSQEVPKEHQPELIELLRCAEANLVAEGKKNGLVAIRGIRRAPGADAEDLEKWRAIASFLLTNDGNWRVRLNVNNGFPMYATSEKRRCQELLAVFSGQENEHPDFRPALLSLDNLPGTAFADWQWQVLEALLEVLPSAIGELKKLFQQEAVTDFVEIAEGARRAIEGSDNVGDIRHLLVDEFQDTSVMQWRLLSALVKDWRPGDERTLFLVGDPMQSIYRFRQAEVGLFIQAKEKGIGNVRPKSLELTVNFRSSALLVKWFNESFANVFGDRDDAGKGVVSFNECYPAPGKTADEGCVRPEWVSNTEDEAERVVKIVREAVDLGHKGDVAILVRARTHLPRIITLLRRDEVAFEAVEIQRLGEVPVIGDLLLLTRALLHPADRLAWIAVLRAPWCGLTLADLDALCGHDHNTAVWDSVTGDLGALSADGRERLERVRDVMAIAMSASRRKPLREWVEGVWIALGGPACLGQKSDLDNAEAFFQLLEGVDEAGEVASVEELSARVEGLFAKSETSTDLRVKVMTIHKAKGLEFDTVIVPGLGRGGQKDDPRLLLWEERAAETGTELLLAPISQKGAAEKDPIYRYLQKAEAERGAEEEKRLLYVAVTRARRNLYLVAEPRLKQDGELRQNRSLLRFLWPRLREDFYANSIGVIDDDPSLAIAASEEPRVPRKLQRLPADWKLPHGPEALRWIGGDIAAPVREGEHITYDWVGEKLRHIGTIVHAMCQRIARDGLKCWPAARIAQSRPTYRAALAERGLGASDLDQAALQVEQALMTLIGDERGRWILSPHRDAQNELSLSGVVSNGRVEHVVLDRTFVDNDGTRWIIDYKTARHEGSGLEAFLDNEQARHKDQLERYAVLLRRLEPERPIHFGLYFPLLKGWRHWKYVG